MIRKKVGECDKHVHYKINNFTSRPAMTRGSLGIYPFANRIMSGCTEEAFESIAEGLDGGGGCLVFTIH